VELRERFGIANEGATRGPGHCSSGLCIVRHLPSFVAMFLALSLCSSARALTPPSLAGYYLRPRWFTPQVDTARPINFSATASSKRCQWQLATRPHSSLLSASRLGLPLYSIDPGPSDLWPACFPPSNTRAWTAWSPDLRYRTTFCCDYC
jgi:hypothetical protein